MSVKRILNSGGLAFVALLLMIPAISTSVPAQKFVDKTVATVSDGTRTELITYSDLMWQIALQPGVPLGPPRKDDLDAALQVVINQRLFALEAGRLPRDAPTDEEISAEIDKTLSHFPSPAVFESRLKKVGFDSVRDDSFEKMIGQRVSIDKYIDFRFRSFTVVTPDEEARYYQEIFVPDFKNRFPGLLVPPLSEKRPEINSILTEERVASRIEEFLDDIKRRAEIEIISEP